MKEAGCIFALLAGLCAAEALSAEEKPAEALLTGKLVLYRPSSMFGAAVACPIRYKGQEIVELGRGKYAEITVPAGQYILTNKTSSAVATVQPGEASYIRCVMKMGALTFRADLQVVDEESFTEHARDFEKKELTSPIRR